jgi:hypothetical protein
MTTAFAAHLLEVHCRVATDRKWRRILGKQDLRSNNARPCKPASQICINAVQACTELQQSRPFCRQRLLFERSNIATKRIINMGWAV